MKYDAYKIKSFISVHDFYLQEQNLGQFNFISNQWAIAGLCPFHKDTKAGSFKINLNTGAFKCWSCGAAGSDIISFLQKRDRAGFIETLDRLSREWSIY